MLESNYHFKAEKGRLIIDENFIPKDAPTIRLHPKIFSCILRILGIAVLVEGIDKSGKKKTWLINVNSYLKRMPKLAPEGYQFDRKNLDGLLTAVKEHSERRKKDSEKPAGENNGREEKKEDKPAEKNIDQQPVQNGQVKPAPTTEIQKPDEQKTPTIQDDKQKPAAVETSNENPLPQRQEKEKSAKKEKTQSSQEVEKTQDNVEKEKVVALPKDQAQKFIKSARKNSIPWNDKTREKLKNVEILQLSQFEPLSEESVEIFQYWSNVKEIMIDILLLKSAKEIEILRKIKDIKNLQENEFIFNFLEPDSLSDDFYRNLNQETYSSAAENLLEFFFDMPECIVSLLNDVRNKGVRFYPFLAELLNGFQKRGGLEKNFVKSLSEKDQQKLFACCMQNTGIDSDVPFQEMINLFIKKPSKLVEFTKAIEFSQDCFLNSLKTFFFALSASGALDENFLRILSAANQKFLTNFVVAHAMSALNDNVFIRINQPEQEYLDSEQILEQCIFLVFKINQDHDAKVKFIESLRNNKFFAPIFLSSSKEQFTSFEKAYKQFVKSKLHEMSNIVHNQLTDESQMRRCLLVTIANIFGTYIYSGVDFSKILEKYGNLTKNLPWIDLQKLNEINELKPFFMSYFISCEVIQKIKAGEKPISIAYEIINFISRPEDSDLRKNIASHLFNHAPQEKKGELLFCFERSSDMISHYLDSVFHANNETLKLVITTFFTNYKQLHGPTPPPLVILLSKIKDSEQLKLILSIIKENNIEDKPKVLQTISGGMNYKDYEGSDSIAKLQIDDNVIQNCFKEAGFEAEYSKTPTTYAWSDYFEK